MSSEIRQTMYVSSWGTSTVTLSPDTSITSLAPHLAITQLTALLQQTTPDAPFWAASGNCARFVVTIQRAG